MSYNAYGGATQLPFNCVINGVATASCGLLGPAPLPSPFYLGPGTVSNNWVEQQWPNTTQAHVISGVPQVGGGGVLGASKTSLNNGMDAYGVTGWVLNDNANLVFPGGAWAAYFEADQNVSNTTGTIGIEIDVGNNAGTIDINPYNMHPYGLNIPLWVACGGAGRGSGGTSGSFTSPCSAAIGILPNVQLFRKGIVFEETPNDTLDPSLGIGGHGVAMEMGLGQSVRWLAPTGGQGNFEMTGQNSGLNFACNSQTEPVTANAVGALCTNYSGTAGEIDFWNLEANGSGFEFRQKTGTTGSTQYLVINSEGLTGTCNSQTIPPTISAAYSICTNYSGGQGEVNFFNLETAAGAGFTFYQKTGATTAALLLSLTSTSGLVAGQVTATEYVISGTPNLSGVSCAAGGTSLTTLVVTGGIVTHC